MGYSAAVATAKGSCTALRAFLPRFVILGRLFNFIIMATTMSHDKGHCHRRTSSSAGSDGSLIVIFSIMIHGWHSGWKS